jgi:hypothetical protein
MFATGQPSGVAIYNRIDRITIATPSNATDFGDLSVNRRYGSACSDGVKGVFGGGFMSTSVPSGRLDTIDYVTIATPGNATDFGDLIQRRTYLAACSGD